LTILLHLLTLTRRLRTSTLISGALLLLITAPASGGLLYGVDSNAQQTGGTSRLFVIDKATGHANQIGELGKQVFAGGMAYDSSSGIMYVSDIFVVTPPTFANYLGSVNLSTGAATLIGQLTGGGSNAVTGLAYDGAHDILYGSGNGTSNMNRLVTVDRATGGLTLVGSMGVRVDGLAYDKQTDSLYGINATSLYKVNRATGTATLVGPHGIGTTSLNLGLEFDQDDGRLFASDTHSLFELDPATGAGTFIGTLGAEVEALASAPNCLPSATTLCLNNGRFKVEATYRTAQSAGPAHAVRLTDDSGYMWFFANTNVEVVIKILDACAFNQKYWVFAAGLTDQQVDITVTDTSNHVQKSYSNALGRTFVTVTDTGAFSTCP
jgi:hypothetical protein